MTLTRLLEIDRALIDPNEAPALAFAELLWRDHGCPTGEAQLSGSLERILVACESEGLRYPPILLRRRKDLQRGQWTPRLPQREAARPSADATAVPTDCQACGNKGFLVNPGGRSATLCSCWMKRLTTKGDPGMNAS